MTSDPPESAKQTPPTAGSWHCRQPNGGWRFTIPKPTRSSSTFCLP
jgi:hypothetical protein